jgi:hypothetical protein
MDALTQWRQIPGWVDAAIANAELDGTPDASGMTVRELVHHIAEANIVAASIIIAAAGSPGCTYDWSWMLPFGKWMDRLDYRSKPIEPALALLGALNAYVAALLDGRPEALARDVHLRDTPDADPRATTIAGVLLAEVDHARGHLLQ